MLSSSICAPGARDMKVLTFQIILSDRVWLGAWRMSTAKSHTSTFYTTTDFLLDSGFNWVNLKTLKACRKHSSFSQISNNMQATRKPSLLQKQSVRSSREMMLSLCGPSPGKYVGVSGSPLRPWGSPAPSDIYNGI